MTMRVNIFYSAQLLLIRQFNRARTSEEHLWKTFSFFMFLIATRSTWGNILPLNFFWFSRDSVEFTE